MQKGKISKLTTILLLISCSKNDGKIYYQLPYNKVNNTISKLTSINAGSVISDTISIIDMQSNRTTSLFHADNSSMIHSYLWITQVLVADFLAGSGLVYQVNDVQYRTACSNLWASPLGQQLEQNLVANLSGLLAGTLISAQPVKNDDSNYQLSVTITGFHGRYDGRAIIQGVWLLTHGEYIVRRTFDLALRQEKDGYDSLVRTLAQGWNIVSQQIAKEFININYNK